MGSIITITVYKTGWPVDEALTIELKLANIDPLVADSERRWNKEAAHHIAKWLIDNLPKDMLSSIFSYTNRLDGLMGKDYECADCGKHLSINAMWGRPVRNLWERLHLATPTDTLCKECYEKAWKKIKSKKG